MTNLPLAKADYHRSVPKEAQIQTRNRYFEANPVLNDQTFALISRPGLKRWLYVGDGPIRKVYSQAGSFDDALFVVSANELWRVDKDKTKTLLTGGLQSAAVSMAATGTIGDVPEYLYIADGRDLYLYIQNGYARGTISGTPANNDVVRVDLFYYKFTTGSVDAGTPNGSSGSPWLVALGTSTTEAWQNLSDAFGATGVAGTAYSSALTASPAASVEFTSATLVKVRATASGAVGNSVTTTETGAAISWTAGFLTGGGNPSITQVQTPDDVGAIAVAYIASYIVVIPAQGEGINGRFWWIEPGETTIDTLNFATAERAPDPVLGVIVFTDQFWLPGQSTTEVWNFTGNIDSPVLRLQGVTFDRGTWQGTAIQIKESMMIIDSDGGVFQIGGGLKRISNPSIEERIRRAIQFQSLYTDLTP